MQKESEQLDIALQIIFNTCEEESLAIDEIKQAQQDSLESLTKQYEEDKRTKLNEEIKLLTDSNELKFQNKQKEFAELQKKTQQLKEIIQNDYDISEAYIPKICGTFLELQFKYERGLPFDNELMELKKLTKYHQELFDIFQQIPDKVASDGIPNINQLSKKFDKLKFNVRNQALISDNPGSLIPFCAKISLALSTNFTSSFLRGKSDPDTVLEKIGSQLSQNHLDTAIDTVQTFSEEPKNVAQSWLRDANQRILIDSLFNEARAHLSKFTKE